MELAEHLNMTVGELGGRMSNYELNVLWPAYTTMKKRVRDRQAMREQMARDVVGGRGR